MAEEVFFTEQLHEQVATYIVRHGGWIKTEAIGPCVFQKVTPGITSCVRFDGSGNGPIYTYALVDGGTTSHPVQSLERPRTRTL